MIPGYKYEKYRHDLLTPKGQILLENIRATVAMAFSRRRLVINEKMFEAEPMVLACLDFMVETGELRRSGQYDDPTGTFRTFTRPLWYENGTLDALEDHILHLLSEADKLLPWELTNETRKRLVARLTADIDRKKTQATESKGP